MREATAPTARPVAAAAAAAPPVASLSETEVAGEVVDGVPDEARLLVPALEGVVARSAAVLKGLTGSWKGLGAASPEPLLRAIGGNCGGTCAEPVYSLSGEDSPVKLRETPAAAATPTPAAAAAANAFPALGPLISEL